MTQTVIILVDRHRVVGAVAQRIAQQTVKCGRPNVQSASRHRAVEIARGDTMR